MKKLILLLFMAYSINTAKAQDQLQNISRGTWVVESNISTPKDQVIKFYNSKFELIYEEYINNRKVRYQKKRIRKVLDKTLQIALANDEKTKPGTFAMLLKSNKK